MKQVSRLRRLMFLTCFFTMCSFLISNGRAQAVEYDSQHRLWQEVLADFVHGGNVDYASLQKSPAKLEHYLDQLAAVTEEEFDRWSEFEQLAYLYNLYNAQTLKVVIDHYPIRSIRDIGGLFAGAWDRRVVRLFGKYTSLNVLKHEVIRQRFNEPRTHFALVLAAKGSPDLRGEPYLPQKLNDQLNEQAELFLEDQNQNRVDDKEKILYLSSIFKWFRKDFEQENNELWSVIRPYAPEALNRAFDDAYSIKYSDYDWRLNQTTLPA